MFTEGVIAGFSYTSFLLAIGLCNMGLTAIRHTASQKHSVRELNKHPCLNPGQLQFFGSVSIWILTTKSTKVSTRDTNKVEEPLWTLWFPSWPLCFLFFLKWDTTSFLLCKHLIIHTLVDAVAVVINLDAAFFIRVWCWFFRTTFFVFKCYSLGQLVIFCAE